MELNGIQLDLLKEIADITDIPTGAYNIRSDSQSIGRQSSQNIDIVPKEGVSGLDIFIKPNTKGETVQKYGALGLLILVAIPLPGTGAWTGALVAALLGMRLNKSVPVIFAGVCIAAAIMTGLTFGVIHVF